MARIFVAFIAVMLVVKIDAEYVQLFLGSWTNPMIESKLSSSGTCRLGW